MNDSIIKVKRALISVSDKKNLIEFAQGLITLNIEIISTGGTAKVLRAENIPVKDVSELTHFPEMMDGRLKTLHPLIHGGILGLRDEHDEVAKEHAIVWIDLVVVNLYPFQQTIQKPDVTFDEAVENIDIGGPTMVRAAAKNMGWVGVVVDPNDYSAILQELKEAQGLTISKRKQLAMKAFQHTAEYDAIISGYLSSLLHPTTCLINSSSQALGAGSSFNSSSRALGAGSSKKYFIQKSGSREQVAGRREIENAEICEQVAGRREDESNHAAMTNKEQEVFPDHLNLHLKKLTELRYGENPHQRAAAYQFPGQKGILSAIQHQGKPLSYNNISDADAAFACAIEFVTPACVVVKHVTPCGAALAENASIAFKRAFAADSLSAFGGVVAFNCIVDQATAELLTDYFIEVVIAPDYSPEALNILSKKSALRVLQLSIVKKSDLQIKSISGGLLLQEEDQTLLQPADLQMVTETIPTPEDIRTMLFAWPILKHIKSNAILLAKDNVTVGVGAGQVSRVDAVTIALKKSGSHAKGAILASDAFFPFRDSIDQLEGCGIRAIIQPGGSMRDGEVIAACNEHKIAMVMTGKRCFKH